MSDVTNTGEDRRPPLWLSRFDRVDIDVKAELREAFANLTPEQDTILLRAAEKLRAMRLAYEAEMRAEGLGCYDDEDEGEGRR